MVIKTTNNIISLIKYRQQGMQNDLISKISIIDNGKKYKIFQDIFGINIKNYNSTVNIATNIESNLIFGLCRGFWMRLELIGVGYKASINKNLLLLKLGRVVEDKYEIPKNICIFIVKTRIYIFGRDKGQVSQVAKDIRNVKIPDAFQGKGIRYFKEILSLKKSKKKKAK